MKKERSQPICPDCETSVDRRQFLTTTASAALAASALPLLSPARLAKAASTRESAAETAVAHFYKTLTDQQKSIVALPFGHELRSRINPNWKITKATVGTLSSDQQDLVKQIIRGVTSEDGYERFLKQMKADTSNGLSDYAVAIFGNPEEGQFQFELTGRHLTLRADGDTLPGAAFGGPIIYGHGAKGNSKENLFSYQTKRAHEVFLALDGKQQEQALLEKAPSEGAVQLRKVGRARPGIAGADLSADQKELVLEVLRDIMLPYRKEDVDEVMNLLKAGGGADSLNIAFYKNTNGGKSADLSDDKVWDVWRLESPNLVCHFRGAPHVHAYINVAKNTA